MIYMDVCIDAHAYIPYMHTNMYMHHFSKTAFARLSCRNHLQAADAAQVTLSALNLTGLAYRSWGRETHLDACFAHPPGAV